MEFDIKILELIQSGNPTNVKLAFQLNEGIDEIKLSEILSKHVSLYQWLLQFELVKKKQTLLEIILELLKVDFLAFDYDPVNIHPEIGLLPNLLEFHTMSIKLKEIPHSICSLSKLEQLTLPINEIKNLPDDICKLKKLKTLNLAYNQLSSLPEEIGSLTSLKILKLNDNNLVSLPQSMYKLSTLEHLTLQGNPLSKEEIDALKRNLPNTVIEF